MNSIKIYRHLVRLHTPKQWRLFFIIVLSAISILPLLNTFIGADHFLHAPEYFITLMGKFVCYAMVAVALDLLWGYCGILSLGHGVFFALGAYLMGMHMLRSSAGEGVYRSKLPDFMVFLDWKEMPWYWWGFQSSLFTVLMILLVPAIASFVFGFFAFRSKIKGVYFSIMTQAMTYALMLLFFRNETGFGGENGLTDFKDFFGLPIQQTGTKLILYIVSVLALALIYLMSRYVVSSRVGLVIRAIRDSESTVCFQGYDTNRYKLFVWVFSAFICGIAGALYVPQSGIINPSEMEPSKSIEMVIWVAVGGRGTLFGAILGAGMVNALRSIFTDWFPDLWLFVLGAMFIAVTLWMPRGLFDRTTLARKTKKVLGILRISKAHAGRFLEKDLK